MKQTLFYLIALIICAATACAPKYSASKLPAEQIIFGNGGGFAGIETSFLLLDNGQIFKKIGQDSVWAAIKSANKKIAKQYFWSTYSKNINQRDRAYEVSPNEIQEGIYWMKISGIHL